MCVCGVCVVVCVLCGVCVCMCMCVWCVCVCVCVYVCVCGVCRVQVGVMADFLDTASVKQLHFIDPIKAGMAYLIAQHTTHTHTSHRESVGYSSD